MQTSYAGYIHHFIRRFIKHIWHCGKRIWHLTGEARYSTEHTYRVHTKANGKVSTFAPLADDHHSGPARRRVNDTRRHHTIRRHLSRLRTRRARCSAVLEASRTEPNLVQGGARYYVGYASFFVFLFFFFCLLKFFLRPAEDSRSTSSIPSTKTDDRNGFIRGVRKICIIGRHRREKSTMVAMGPRVPAPTEQFCHGRRPWYQRYHGDYEDAEDIIATPEPQSPPTLSQSRHSLPPQLMRLMLRETTAIN
jgi:hypothetical protein